MDFYRRKEILNKNTRAFLSERERNDKPTWDDFCRDQALSLGVSEKMCLGSLHMIEPRLTVKEGQLIKVADVETKLPEASADE